MCLQGNQLNHRLHADALWKIFQGLGTLLPLSYSNHFQRLRLSETCLSCYPAVDSKVRSTSRWECRPTLPLSSHDLGVRQPSSQCPTLFPSGAPKMASFPH